MVGVRVEMPSNQPIVLLREVAALVRRKGLEVQNVDVVVVLERPKVGPHRAAIESSPCRSGSVPEIRVTRCWA